MKSSQKNLISDFLRRKILLSAMHAGCVH